MKFDQCYTKNFISEDMQLCAQNTKFWMRIALFIFITLNVCVNTAHATDMEERYKVDHVSSLKIANVVKLNTFSTFKVAVNDKKSLVALLGFSNLKRSNFIVSIYNSKNWILLKTLNIDAPLRVTFDGGLQFSRDGNYLAAGIKKVMVWNTNDWKLECEIDGPFAMGEFAAQNVQAMSFDTSSTNIAILYDNVWWPQLSRIDDGSALSVLESQNRSAISNNEQPNIARESRIFLYNVKTGDLLNSTNIFEQRDKRESTVPSKRIIANSLEGNFVVSGMHFDKPSEGIVENKSSFMTYINQKNVTIRKVFNDIQSDVVVDFALSNDGKTIVTAGNNGNSNDKFDPVKKTFTSVINDDTLRIWNATSGKLLTQIQPPLGLVKSISFSSGDDKIIACHTDPHNKTFFSVWSTKSGSLLAQGGIPSHDNSSFLTCGIITNESTIVVPVFVSSMLNLSKSDELYIIKF